MRPKRGPWHRLGGHANSKWESLKVWERNRQEKPLRSTSPPCLSRHSRLGSPSLFGSKHSEKKQKTRGPTPIGLPFHRRVPLSFLLDLLNITLLEGIFPTVGEWDHELHIKINRVIVKSPTSWESKALPNPT